jgi:hypothetical protein
MQNPKAITKIVYFCGICHKIIPKTLFCKSCKKQFPNEELDDE